MMIHYGMLISVMDRSLRFQSSTKHRGIHFFYDPKTGAIYMLFGCKKKFHFDRRELEFCTC